jgi:hypothetical protein
MNDLLKQDSEYHIGTNNGDGMTGAPVIEHRYINNVLNEVNMIKY